MAKLDVSVIIPCFNRERFIGEAIDSALSQGDGVDVIIVDDGSTDRSWERIAAYGDRITAVKSDRRGPSAARNLGLGRARGKYAHFLDSDDRLAPGALNQMVNAAQRLGPGRIAVGRLVNIDEKGELIGGEHMLAPGGDIPRAQVLSRPLSNPLSLYPAAALRDLGGFDERLWHNEDRELSVRLLTNGFQFCRVPVTIVQVRIHQDDRLSSDRSCAAYGQVAAAIEAMRDALIKDKIFMESAEERAAFATLCWTCARDAARAKCRSVAEPLFDLAGSLDAESKSAHWLMRLMYRIMSPYSAEQLINAIKMAAALPVVRGAKPNASR